MIRNIKRIALATSFLAVSAVAALAQAPVPEGYPQEYAEIIAKAEKEGKLSLHSNMQSGTWKPILEGFNKRYPFIEVEALNFEDEMFERYLAEKAAGGAPADVMVTSSIGKWVEFAKRGEVAQYVSPETANLPEWAQPLPGVYAVSADPYVIAYNKMTIPADKHPNSVADVVTYLKENPGATATTYDPLRGANGHASWSAWLEATGENGWAMADAMGPQLRGETAGAQMLDKVMVGEYSVAVFLAMNAVKRILEKPGASDILAYSFATDGTPIVPRGGAITEGAAHPNAARLFMDYLLSEEGQTALAQSLTPVRSDIADEIIVRGRKYDAIAAEIGEENIIRVPYDESAYTNYDAFVERWKKAQAGGK